MSLSADTTNLVTVFPSRASGIAGDGMVIWTNADVKSPRERVAEVYSDRGADSLA